MNSRTLSLASALALASLPAVSAAAPAPVPPPAALAPVSFLVGTWSGSGTSDAGTGGGTDTFELAAGGDAVLRRSRASYPAADGHPASTYDAVMMIYADPAHPGLRADYIDNGNHAIHYALVPGTDPHIAQFVSDAVPGAPRFRLTYTDAPDDKSMQVLFELAPPGSATFVTTIAKGVENRVPAVPPQ